jgi:glycosyltransferase involved in cell wall biosynthesis
MPSGLHLWHAAPGMLRVLVHAPYYRPHVGGLETYVEELHESLWAVDGVSAVTVLTPDIPAGAPAREQQPDGTLVIRYPALEVITGFPVPRFWSRDWRSAKRDAFATRPDVVVGHTRFFVSSALAHVHARRLRARHLHVEHGSDYVQMTRRWPGVAARVYDETFGRLVLRLADRRIVVSTAAQAFVRRLAGVDATVAYRGLPRDRLAAAHPTPEAARLGGGRPVLAFVGRLMDGKGVHDLIDATDALVDDVLCVIVGDGPARATWEERAARSRHPDRFVFTGYLPEVDALAWVMAADVVVNPSYTEGLPSTVLWGAACGRAVVATTVGGTPEIVTDGASALLYEARDVDALRRALEAVVGDPALRARLGAAAKADVWGRFDTVAGAQRWLAVARGEDPGPLVVYAAPEAAASA